MSHPFDQLAKAFLHRDRLELIAEGKIPRPVSVKIELANVCNHDCHFCAYRRLVQSPKVNDLLDTQRVLDLVDELAEGGVKGLMFTGGGEPLLHSGLPQILQRCRERKVEHGLITNGVRLGSLTDAALAGLRWIRFSINAGSEAQYRDVHGVSRDDWSEVWTQVRRCSDRERFPRLAVGVSFVVTTRNQESMQAAALRAKEQGANYVHFRPAFEGPHTQLERQLSRDEQSAAVALFEAMQALEDANFKVYGIQRRFEEIATPDTRYIHCRSTPLVAYVLPNGAVSLCTLVRDRRFNPKVPNPFLGNIHESSFFELWGSQHHHDLITALSDSGCHRCHFSIYNRAVEMIASDRMHNSFL